MPSACGWGEREKKKENTYIPKGYENLNGDRIATNNTSNLFLNYANWLWAGVCVWNVENKNGTKNIFVSFFSVKSFSEMKIENQQQRKMKVEKIKNFSFPSLSLSLSKFSVKVYIFIQFIRFPLNPFETRVRLRICFCETMWKCSLLFTSDTVLNECDCVCI